jgi:hypothetical protein
MLEMAGADQLAGATKKPLAKWRKFPHPGHAVSPPWPGRPPGRLLHLYGRRDRFSWEDQFVLAQRLTV